MTDNMQAFLSMLSVSEGTHNIGSERGYNVLVGGTIFEGYADHPRQCVQLSKTLKSTAAGRYQILERYYDAYKKQLGLVDFGPRAQDVIALQLIKECRATKLIDDGKIRDAINACSSRWASLPGAGYGQRENSLASLLKAYQAAGGTLA